MNILNLEHVSKSFENRVLLDDVTLGLEDTDKIGVIGINGTGKSTLLSITAGTLAPDEGKVVRGKEIRAFRRRFFPADRESGRPWQPRSLRPVTC